MKWTKWNNDGAGCLGQGYESGDYVIEETFNSYELQQQYGGKRVDYYWQLIDKGEVVKYASTAKALKQFAETL